MIDFNEAEQQTEFTIIPVNTIAKARLTIKAGNDFSDSFLTRSKDGNSTYLDCEFVIMEGLIADRASEFVRRKIFDKIGISGSDVWVNMGKSRIRAIIESAKNVNPKDMSETAILARKIDSFGELEGLEPIIKIGIEHDRGGVYPDKNRVASIITPDHKLYQMYMSASDIPWGN
jgi:hypothetical protein